MLLRSVLKVDPANVNYLLVIQSLLLFISICLEIGNTEIIYLYLKLHE